MQGTVNKGRIMKVYMLSVSKPGWVDYFIASSALPWWGHWCFPFGTVLGSCWLLYISQAGSTWFNMSKHNPQSLQVSVSPPPHKASYSSVGYTLPFTRTSVNKYMSLYCETYRLYFWNVKWVLSLPLCSTPTPPCMPCFSCSGRQVTLHMQPQGRGTRQEGILNPYKS